jgi:tRNA A-37 threonylcarbamoyl transferase component Bud32
VEEVGQAESSPLGELPRSGPLAAFRAIAVTLSHPSDAARPWVLACGDRVIKAYDLRAFDALDRRRALAEAETAIAAGDIDGVVTAHRAGRVGNWLVIEMDRLGVTVAEHLAMVVAGAANGMAMARWGGLLEEVGITLEELHRRRIIHRDVKPANLMFSRSGDRLVLADFSIASTRSRRVREDRTGQAGDVAGTRRYIAPEVFQGRVGYEADQYGLAVTAEDVLGDGVTPAARAVLLRATEQEPEDRFASTADFAIALRAALDDHAPRRLSSRLQRVSPKWRCTWGIGAATMVGAYALLVALRIPDLSWLAGLIIPLLAAGPSMVMARLLSRLRGKRTQPRLGLADRGWFPVLLFALAFIAYRPILANNPGNLGKFVLYAWIGSLAIAAALGSMQRNAGEWLIRFIQRWERWRETQRQRSVRWWGGRVAVVTSLLAISWIPAAVGARWPNGAGPSSAAEYPPIVAVAHLRAAMLTGDAARACGFTQIPVAPKIAPCWRWSSLATKWLHDDVDNNDASDFTVRSMHGFDVSYNDGSEKYGPPSWAIWTADGDRNYVGMLSREDDSGEVWEVAISRRPPQGDPLAFQQAFWGYEVVHQKAGWKITGVEVCDWSTNNDCARISQMPKAKLAAIARRGVRGRRVN